MSTRLLLKLFFVLPLVLAGHFAHALSSYAVFGDGGHANTWVSAVRGSILSNGVRNIVLLGDNLYDPDHTYEQIWTPWRRDGMSFDIVALGNHLLSYRQEMRYFEMPGEYYTRRADPRAGSYRFVVLNSDNEDSGREQAFWFDQVMSNAPEEFIFVVFHHPPFTLSERHPWQEREGFHRHIRPLLFKHRARIRAVLVGHDHSASLVSLEGLPLVVSGAVAEYLPSPAVDYEEQGIRVRTKWMSRPAPHWVRLDIDSSKRRVFVHFVQALTNQIVCSAELLIDHSVPSANCGRVAY